MLATINRENNNKVDLRFIATPFTPNNLVTYRTKFE
jgi:hypothetical protein